MNIVVNRIHEAFDYQFKDALKKREKSKSQNLDKKVMYSASSKWSKLKGTVKSFFANYIHMLDTLTDKSIVEFGINALSKYIPLVAPLENLAKRLLKKLLDVWSSADVENTRLIAYLRVRQLVLESSPTFMEQAMKSIYLSYVRNAKFVNEATIPSLSLPTTVIPTTVFFMTLFVEDFLIINHSRKLLWCGRWDLNPRTPKR